MTEFREPKITINRVYTRQGDQGLTCLVGGQKIPKNDLRIECYGTVDELNAYLGRCAAQLTGSAIEELKPTILAVQHTLFNLGSILATLPEDVGPMMPRVRADDVTTLEQSIDQANERLPTLTSFVLPGGTVLNADLHVARTVCRRAERLCVALVEGGSTLDEWSIPYLNRLSDALFVWSRLALVAGDHGEVLWQPNHGS